MALKPSAVKVLLTMKNCRMLKNDDWWTVRDLIVACPTNTPTKRLSELFKEGLILKRRHPSDPRFMQYKVKEAQ